MNYSVSKKTLLVRWGATTSQQKELFLLWLAADSITCMVLLKTSYSETSLLQISGSKSALKASFIPAHGMSDAIKMGTEFPGKLPLVSHVFQLWERHMHKTFRPNIRLLLITHAAKFIGSHCPFELGCEIFHIAQYLLWEADLAISVVRLCAWISRLRLFCQEWLVIRLAGGFHHYSRCFCEGDGACNAHPWASPLLPHGCSGCEAPDFP